MSQSFPTPEPPETKPAKSANNNWVFGLILIGLGALFLLQNLGVFSLDNWWALFILIPAFSSFGNAYRMYRRDGQLTAAARSSIFGGLIMTFIAAVFLFNLDFGRYWPVLLILGGLAALFSGLFPDR